MDMEIGHTSIPMDTSIDCFEQQTEVLRQMGIGRRAALTFELSDNLRSVTQSGIRSRHPEYNESQVTQAYLRLILEPKLFKQVFPNCEIQP